MGPLVLLQALGKSYSLPRNYHKANEAGDWESQHRFTRGKSWQINLITFYSKMTFSVYMGTVVEVVNLDFSKIFDHVSHGLLLEELTR